MKINIGSAPDPWGVWFANDSKQTPWFRFLDEVAEADYQWIELGPYGYLPTDEPTLRAELTKRNLKVCAATVISNLEQPSAWSGLEKQVLGSGDLVAALGAKYLVLIDDPYTNLFTGKSVEPARLDESSWKRLIDTTNKVAAIAQDRFGLAVVFHPHAETHVEYEDQIEALLEQTDPGRVGLCLDTGHHAYRGGDPVSFIRRHHQRIAYLHLKSVDGEMQKKWGLKAFHLLLPWEWTFSASPLRVPWIFRVSGMRYMKSTFRVGLLLNKTCIQHHSISPCPLPSAPAPIFAR